MPLSPNEASVLRYLGKQTATARNVSRDLHLNRTAVRKALLGLAGAGLVFPDRSTWPPSYAVTGMGGAVLAAALSGEAGFSAQDDMPPGIQGSPAEAARIDALERRNAAAGLDLYGSPLEPS